MGMSLGSTSGSKRRFRRNEPLSEINVTPFVDVMLVLLIVFMVTAPLLTVGVPIDLPENRAQQLNSQTQPITVSLMDGGKVFLQETEVTTDELVAKLTAIALNGYDERLYVRADRTLDYGIVMRVMGLLNDAGYKRIALVALQEQGG